MDLRYFSSKYRNSMTNIYVALVRHSSNLNSTAAGDLRFFQSAMSSAGIRYEIQCWDNPSVVWKSYSHIILTSQIDYDDKIDEFLQWISDVKSLISENSTKLWNSPQTIDWNYSKEYLLELQSKSIRIPETLLVNDVKENVSEWLEERLDVFGKNGSDAKVVVKSVVSAGGKSVWRCNLIRTEKGSCMMQAADLDRVRQQILSSKGKCGILIQEYLPAILTEGEWSLVYFNRVFSHAVLKKPRGCTHVAKHGKLQDESEEEEEFRTQVYYGGTFEPVEPENVPEKLLRFGNNVLAQIPGTILHARVDIVNSVDGEPCLMECEVLDPDLYQTEAIYGERYLQALMSINDAMNFDTLRDDFELV